MDILSGVRNFFSIFFNFGFAVSAKPSVFNVAKVGHVEAKANFCFHVQVRTAHEHSQPSYNPVELSSRVSANTTSHYSNINPFVHNRSSENQESTQSFNRFHAQGTFDQSLQLQINQLQNENNSVLSKIAMNRIDSHYSRPFQSLFTFESKENKDKHNELTKLDVRLHNISNFCNEEMVEVLKLVSEACVNLEGKLANLRKETTHVKDDLQLFENIEHIGHLEKILESLHQLETKFQGMQKDIFAKGQVNVPSKNAQEAQVSFLIEKIERLNREKHLLEISQQQLPSHAVYDLKELQDLIKISESEREELVQKLDVTRRKYNLAKEFGSEVTNHLLDYAVMFKDFIPKLRSKVSLSATDLSAFTAKGEVKPLSSEVKPLHSVACNTMSHASREQKVQVSNEDNSDANEFKFAATEVAKALRQLMEVA